MQQYQVYIRNDWPLPFVEPWAVGPTQVAKPPFRWKMILVTNLGDKYAWCYFAKDVIKIGHEIDKFLSSPKNLKNFKAKAEVSEKECKILAGKILHLDISALSDPGLADLLKRWCEIYYLFTARFMPIDATDETLESDFRHALETSKIKLSFQDVADLLTPDLPTYVQREHKDFCSLAQKYLGRISSQVKRKALEKHLGKWWWTVMGWGQHKPMDREFLIKKLSKEKDVKQLLKTQQKEEKARKLVLNRKKKLLAQLPVKIKNFLSAFEVLAEMHDTRKEVQMKMMTAGFKITDLILKRQKVSAKYRNFILLEEYLKLHQQKPSVLELEKRKKYYWYEVWNNGGSEMLSGKKAWEKIRQSGINSQGDKQTTKEIKGLPASPGKAIGRAKVELNAEVLNRTIQKGEILITSQTTPEFAPAMKKAAAIVTDEGGITSHAAIVSRELGIPCVIGTKIATKVFKDGDLVEVDANKGLVRKV
jgi:phosphohistidine swiveling domain-containing protein